MNRLAERYQKWRYKNTALLILSLVLFFFLAETPFVDNLIRRIGSFGFIGAFLGGIFFVSTFTVVPASAVLFHIAQALNPLGVAIAAGAGAVIGDYLIFRFLKDEVFDELKPILSRLGDSHLGRLISTPYFAWFAPVMGAIIIASPFPDEVGISLMGISQLKNWQFLIISFVLNSLGILLVVTLARSF
ncbi:MAG: hypothetical protein HY470_00060 [Candidatus Ryanbacteria bacterium]|nr:hypothetical protein [Candidatus Ryanbacteria bacterium]